MDMSTISNQKISILFYLQQITLKLTGHGFRLYAFEYGFRN